MFTGLIEQVGRVKELSKRNHTPRLVIDAPRIAKRLRTGDSISVSGVCLTALNINKTSFAADLAAETLARTNLSYLLPGSQVNLELPMKAGSPLGGHIVQGHVDGVAKLISLNRIPSHSDWRLFLELPANLPQYVVDKGSITINGISLTVASIVGQKVEIAIIPHTYNVTDLKTLHSGDLLNIEVDVLAKYAQKRISDNLETITWEKLLQAGF